MTTGLIGADHIADHITEVCGGIDLAIFDHIQSLTISPLKKEEGLAARLAMDQRAHPPQDRPDLVPPYRPRRVARLVERFQIVNMLCEDVI